MATEDATPGERVRETITAAFYADGGDPEPAKNGLASENEYLIRLLTEIGPDPQAIIDVLANYFGMKQAHFIDIVKWLMDLIINRGMSPEELEERANRPAELLQARLGVWQIIAPALVQAEQRMAEPRKAEEPPSAES